MRLVLLHALPFGGEMWRAERDLLPEPALTPSLYGFGTTLAEWAEGVCWRPLFGRDAPAEAIAEAERMALAQDVDDVVRGVRAFHDRRDLTAFAAAWPKPIVVVSGDQDRHPLPSTAAAVVGDAPDRRFHLVPSCGHYVNLERPTEFRALLADVVRWLGGDTAN